MSFAFGIAPCGVGFGGLAPKVKRDKADHGSLKRVIKPSLGFKSLPKASATLKGSEVMGMIRKGRRLTLDSGTAGEVRIVNRLFRLAA